MKMQFPNNYEDWSYRDKSNMHGLYLSVREWFVWTNVFWAVLMAWVLTKSISISVLAMFVAFYLVFKIATGRHEFVSTPKEEIKI